MPASAPQLPLRSAWVEIHLQALRRNFDLLRQAVAPSVQVLAVVKDDAYGHGALPVARATLEAGAWGLAVATLARAAARAGRRVPAHLNVNTGMNRYGVRWTGQGQHRLRRARRLAGAPAAGVFAGVKGTGRDQKRRAALAARPVKNLFRHWPLLREVTVPADGRRSASRPALPPLFLPAVRLVAGASGQLHQHLGVGVFFLARRLSFGRSRLG